MGAEVGMRIGAILSPASLIVNSRTLESVQIQRWDDAPSTPMGYELVNNMIVTRDRNSCELTNVTFHMST